LFGFSHTRRRKNTLAEVAGTKSLKLGLTIAGGRWRGLSALKPPRALAASRQHLHAIDDDLNRTETIIVCFSAFNLQAA